MTRFVFLLPLSMLLAGCLAESSPTLSGEAGGQGLSLRIGAMAPAGLAARAQSAEPGGKLLVEVSNPGKGLLLRDSCTWSGAADQEISFPSLGEGTGYVAKARYRDPSGTTSHGDSIGGIRIGRGETAIVRLALRALLGKVVLNAPAVPAGVDTLGMSWLQDGELRVAKAPRGSGGRTTLRLDSLGLGAPGALSLRAWNAVGDTLFHLDTTLVLCDDRDLPLSLNLQSAQGSVLAALRILPGGEIAATASFAGESDQPSVQDGRLLLVAFSDSGNSDWIGILNPGSDFEGTVRLGKGGSDAQFPLKLASGGMAVATRASCESVSAAGHVLHGLGNLHCGLADVIVTHSTSGGSYWKLRSGDGSILHDAVLVLDARQSWPDLNTTTARTARLRAERVDATSNDAGFAWCADGSDAPDAACP